MLSITNNLLNKQLPPRDSLITHPTDLRVLRCHVKESAAENELHKACNTTTSVFIQQKLEGKRLARDIDAAKE